MEAALAYSRESRTEALNLLDEALYNRLAAGTAWESRFASGAFCDLERDADSGQWRLLDRWGRILVHRDGQLAFSSTVSDLDLDAVAVDLEPSAHGWVVLDGLGGIHPVNKTTNLPGWMLLPMAQETICQVESSRQQSQPVIVQAEGYDFGIEARDTNLQPGQEFHPTEKGRPGTDVRAQQSGSRGDPLAPSGALGRHRFSGADLLDKIMTLDDQNPPVSNRDVFAPA